MTKDEALKLALEALQTLHDENMDYLTRNKLGGENNQCMVFAREAITAIKEALAQPEQEPDYWLGYGLQAHTEKPFEGATPVYNTPPQRTWVGLIRGVRVEGDTVVISVKGGNDAARELCSELVNEMGVRNGA